MRSFFIYFLICTAAFQWQGALAGHIPVGSNRLEVGHQRGRGQQAGLQRRLVTVRHLKHHYY